MSVQFILGRGIIGVSSIYPRKIELTPITPLEDYIGAKAIEAYYGVNLTTGQPIPGDLFDGGARTQRLLFGIADFAGALAAMLTGTGLSFNLGAGAEGAGAAGAGATGNATAETVVQQPGLIGAGEGAVGGRIPLNGVPVTLQPTANTCVPASLDMLLGELAPGRAATSLVDYILRPLGMTTSDAIGFIGENLKDIGMRIVRADLSQALGNGRPFIAIVDQEGHAVLVQGLVEVDGVRYVIVRDPACGAYLESLADFDARLCRDPQILSNPTITGAPE